MHRFYLIQSLTGKISISEERIVHQISRVFRAKKGDTFCFFGKDTQDHIYSYDGLERGNLNFILKETAETDRKEKTQLSIFQAYPHKSDTLETIVQKLVEIGVDKLVLFRGERSQVSEISENKRLRLEKISIEALEQCGGNNPLDIIYSKNDQPEILAQYLHLMHIVANPRGERSLPHGDKNTPIGLWIGPEGGWSPEEESYFKKKDIYQWHFNDQILRLETACIVGAGIMTYLWAE